RDVSKQLGKEVELVISGGDTELDKSMVDVIADPLTHLVRNSLDHGIERPEERTAAGKPAKGKLALHAYHEAGAIVIEVSDDGRGLARDKILDKAIERGLVAAEAQLSDAEVWQLIFAPGFSTAEQVTNVSGRGVGMDVVKRNIESLRGQISMASQPGRGTTIQLRLPLTLAIIDGFLTQVGRVHYVIPLAVVAECIDLPAACRTADGGATPMAGTFDLRGDVLPWLDLAQWYGHVDADAPRPARRSLVLVRSGAQRIGIIVDRLLGEHQTVIKPLAGIFSPLKALAGSTILGSGEVALVLDMAGLVEAAVQAARQARQPGAGRSASPAVACAAPWPLPAAPAAAPPRDAAVL
ncbi:MAG: chemotaxis protein CheA, partial [Rubrivivax sp.]|nr:chemotaxis protein CheA [Rubrivivax sp.]